MGRLRFCNMNDGAQLSSIYTRQGVDNLCANCVLRGVWRERRKEQGSLGDRVRTE
jgi:hypothetical protein